jgi:hypothetical protein
MREVKDWIVVNLAYKPYDIVDDWLRQPYVLEWLGLVSVTAWMCWGLHRTTDIAYWIGLSDVSKYESEEK